ncbi:MAG: hypothetical protein AAFQ04_09400 [Pseudomonadota bacterium]
MCEKKQDEVSKDWSKLLDHSRSLFVYHAGQRLNSTRYFFAIYGVIFGGYISVLGEEKGGVLWHAALAAIALFGLLVALVYRNLDLRNAELVGVDENAMHFVEMQILNDIDESFEVIEDFPNPSLASRGKDKSVEALLISKKMDSAPFSQNGYTYAAIFGWTFEIAWIVPAIAVACHIFYLAKPLAIQ